jgi:hypothetical protein
MRAFALRSGPPAAIEAMGSREAGAQEAAKTDLMTTLSMGADRPGGEEANEHDRVLVRHFLRHGVSYLMI